MCVCVCINVVYTTNCGISCYRFNNILNPCIVQIMIGPGLKFYFNTPFCEKRPSKAKIIDCFEIIRKVDGIISAHFL